MSRVAAVQRYAVDSASIQTRGSHEQVGAMLGKGVSNCFGFLSNSSASGPADRRIVHPSVRSELPDYESVGSSPSVRLVR